MTDLKFQKLTPYHNADISSYEEALDYAFFQNDIKNIAISGAYSSGKSSVIETYEKLNPKLKSIHISLAHFNKEELIDEEDDKNFTENLIEGKILNQLIQQIEPNEIPQTSFKVKRTISKRSVVSLSLISLLFMILLIYNVKYNDWRILLEMDKGRLLYNLLLFTLFPCSRIISIIVILAITYLYIYKVLYAQKARNILKRINVQGNEIEIFENEDSSYFDKYLNEVLYVFENVDADCIIFEDIDRFENSTIFERLREINTLVNIRLQEQKDKSRKTIKFVYLLRDDIFQSKERTKFFDFIIPIVPIVDSSNSYDLKKKHLETSNLYIKFDDHFIRGISLYLDDYRLIKNILNEFLVYESRLNKIDLNLNKLFAVITYKNLFPKDFSDLQLNKGYVYAIFNNKEAIREEYLSVLYDKKEEFEIRLSNSEKELSNSLQELEYIKKGKENDFYYDYNKRNQYNKWLKEILPIRQQAVKDSEKEQRIAISKKIDELKLSIQECKNYTLSELINNENSDNVFRVSTINDIGEKNEYESIRKSDYYALLKYLITNGYLDETYPDYMSYFYPNSLTINDKMFVRSVTDRKRKEFNYPINNPQLVMQHLNDHDLLQLETINLDLAQYILNSKNKEYIQSYITNICKNECLDFVSSFMDNKDPINLVRYINKQFPNYFLTMLSSNKFTKSQLVKYCFISFEYNESNEVILMNIDDTLVNYVNDNLDFIEYEKINKLENVISSFKTLDICFEFINSNKPNHDLFDNIYNLNMYQINEVNIKYLIEYKLQKSVNNYLANFSTHILRDEDIPLCSYLKNNINMFMQCYLSFYSDEITDDESTIIWILNHPNINNDEKEKYINQATTRISDVSKIEDKSLFTTIIKKSLMKYTTNNIVNYYSEYSLATELVQFINSNKQILDFTEIDNVSDFANDCIAEKGLNDVKYDQLSKKIFEVQEQFNIEDLSKNKIEILVNNNIILMNKSNLTFFRLHYPNSVINFICKNFNDYINILNTNIENEKEIHLLLKSKNLSIEQKKLLLDNLSISISIQDLQISNDLILDILMKHFDTKDLNYLLSIYKSSDTSIQQAILKTININFDEFIDMLQTIDFNMLKILLSNSIFEENDKLALFKKLFDIKNKNDILSELSNILRLLGATKINGNIYDNSNERVDYNEFNKFILNVLFSNEIIHKPVLTSDNKHYKKIKLILPFDNKK